MSYRFLWKQIASKALSSAMAKALLAMDWEKLWDHAMKSKSLSREQVLRFRDDLERTLKDVEEKGRKERELVLQVVGELVKQVLKRGGG